MIVYGNSKPPSTPGNNIASEDLEIQKRRNKMK
jgi:hypothetical protein